MGPGGSGSGDGLRRVLHPQHHPGDVVDGLLHPLLPRPCQMLRRAGGSADQERLVAGEVDGAPTHRYDRCIGAAKDEA